MLLLCHTSYIVFKVLDPVKAKDAEYIPVSTYPPVTLYKSPEATSPPTLSFNFDPEGAVSAADPE